MDITRPARSGERRLRAVILPPMPWKPERDAYRIGLAPDPFALDRDLRDCGVDVALIDPGRGMLNPLAGHSTVLQSLDPLRALRVVLTERRADIVVSVFEGAALPITLVRWLVRFPAPVVLWDIGLTETWRVRERILDQVVPRVDGIFVLSTSQRDYIHERWQRKTGVEVLGHGIDTHFFDPMPFAPTGPLLSLGNDPGRDFPTLIAAVQGLDIEVVIRSQHASLDGLQSRNIAIITDRISPVALRDLYGTCRFVVIPLHRTLNASGVTTILEAAAMGLASIVSDNPAIRDFIIPGETCLVVPCGDPVAMRIAIERLQSEPKTCARLGAAARRFVEQHCAQPVFGARLASLLHHYSRIVPIDRTTSFDR